MAIQIARFIISAIEIYQYILVFYALSTWFRPKTELFNQIKLMLKSAADLIIKPIEQLAPQLRFFSVIISYFILEFVRIYVINSFT